MYFVYPKLEREQRFATAHAIFVNNTFSFLWPEINKCSVNCNSIILIKVPFFFSEGNLFI